MKAGTLRHTVTVQPTIVLSVGDRGQPITTNTVDNTNVPAMIEELTGRQFELARQQVNTCTHRITIRYLASLKVSDRIVFGDRIFNIGWISNKALVGFTHEILATEIMQG